MSMNQELSAGGVGESGVVLQITTVDGPTRETVLPGVTVEGWMKENVRGRGETVIESDPIEATVVFADGTEVGISAYLNTGDNGL